MLKNGQQWDFIVQIFKIVPSTLETQVTKYLQIVCPVLLDKYVIRYEENIPCKKLKMILELSNFSLTLATLQTWFFKGQIVRLKIWLKGKHISLKNLNFIYIKLKYLSCRLNFTSDVLHIVLPSFLIYEYSAKTTTFTGNHQKSWRRFGYFQWRSVKRNKYRFLGISNWQEITASSWVLSMYSSYKKTKFSIICKHFWN